MTGSERDTLEIILNYVQALLDEVLTLLSVAVETAETKK